MVRKGGLCASPPHGVLAPPEALCDGNGVYRDLAPVPSREVGAVSKLKRRENGALLATKQAMVGRGSFHGVPCKEAGNTAISEQASSGEGSGAEAESRQLDALHGTWGDPPRGA